MKGRFCLFAFLLIVSFSLVSAQESVNIDLKSTSFEFSDVLVGYEIRSFSTEQIFYGSIQTDYKGTIFFDLSQGFYEFSVYYDNQKTSGYDYFGKISSSTDSPIELNLYRVGSLRIFSVDKLNKPIQKVLVRVDCENSRGEQGYFRTDEFGIVEAKFVPRGNCTIRGAFEDYVVSQNIEIEQGSKDDVTLVFEEYSSKSASYWLLIVLVLILVAAYFFFQNKKKQVEEKTSSKEDIITALSEQEKKVVRFMLQEQEKFVFEKKREKDFYLSQAKIIYGAGIPKTTLVRLLQNLESKQILEVKKEGKLKKIRLTEWFRSK